MKAAKFFLSVVVFVGLAACSTTGGDVVVSRSDDLSSRPSWAKEAESFKIEDGTVYSLGTTTISADSRIEAGYRIAENNAKGAIASAIEQRLNYIFQNAEEGTELDARQTRFIGAEFTKLTTSSIRPGGRYWEKVATTDANGQKKLIYRVYARVSMPEEDFKKAIFDAIRRAQGKVGLSQDFAQKVDQHWNEFVTGE